MTSPALRRTAPPARRSRARALVAGAALLALAPLHPPAQAGPADPAPPAAEPAGAGRWSDTPHGFASLGGGTRGGAGGAVVTVSDTASLARYAAAEEPYVIRVSGTVTVAPFGTEIRVASRKTIVGVGDTAELVHGGLYT